LISKKEDDLLHLKEDIEKMEPNEVIRKVYQWKINEKIAELHMLRAAFNNDDRRFSRYSRFIYRSPEADVDMYTMTK
jgi:hypothetical protein